MCITGLKTPCAMGIGLSKNGLVLAKDNIRSMERQRTENMGHCFLNNTKEPKINSMDNFLQSKYFFRCFLSI